MKHDQLRQSETLFCPFCQVEHEAISVHGRKLAVCPQLKDLPENTFVDVNALNTLKEEAMKHDQLRQWDILQRYDDQLAMTQKRWTIQDKPVPWYHKILRWIQKVIAH